LDYTRGGELNANSKRLFILFTCCKLGEANADERFYNLSTKTINRPNAGYGEGMPDSQLVARNLTGSDDSTVNFDLNSAGHSRRKRRSAMDVLDLMRAEHNNGVREMASAAHNRNRLVEENNAACRPSMELVELEKRSKLWLF